MAGIEREDYRRLLIGVILVAAASIFTFVVFFVASRQSRSAGEDDPAADDPTQFEEPTDQAKIDVELHFYVPPRTPSSSIPLVKKTRQVVGNPDPEIMARRVIGEILRGPDDDLPSLFPPNSRLRQVYLLPDGTAVVDLSAEAAAGLPGGAIAEFAALRSITQTLKANIEGVKRVKFLVAGQDSATFGGHVSLRDPFM